MATPAPHPPKPPASRVEAVPSSAADLVAASSRGPTIESASESVTELPSGSTSAPNSTLGLQGLAWLLAAQAAGELITRAVSLPLPGPVLGMVLLLFALRWPAVRNGVGVCANFLLMHLSLLFVPVGVGVMTHVGLVGQYGGRMLAVLVLSSLMGLAVTVLVMHWLRGKDHG